MKRERNGWQQFFFILGIVVVVLSGGCSVLFVGMELASSGLSQFFQWISLPFIIGGPPMLFGALLIVLARGRPKP